ncbi:MAG TPA: UvrD-helicase domain-containing protein [Polyangiaceae bacterium]|nr:UvrD-helicase domain-containing protein [Polyangiaceae bacterium]
MSELVDARARQVICSELHQTLVVEAAAGTGKTTALISRIVAVIRSGSTVLTRVVAVTFTEKAAGEMKLRLRAELDRARQEADEAAQRAHLEQALAALEVAHINTIHGFCADLLRERPIDAGIDPQFAVLDETSSEALLREAFQNWFERALSDPGAGLRRMLRRRNWRAERSTPREELLRACRDLVEYRDFDRAWAFPEFEREPLIDELLLRFQTLASFQSQALRASDPLARAMTEFRSFVEELDKRKGGYVQKRDYYDALELELSEFLRNKERTIGAVGSGRLYGQSLDRSAVVAERDEVVQSLRRFVALAEADLAAHLRQELLGVVHERERLKQRLGALDFVDLLSRTRDLLTGSRSVREQLQNRFTHLFVDEFQDTDPLQAEILMLLASDSADTADYRQVRSKPGKLFVVGDPKQAIYRFRRADVTLYERIKSELLAQGAQLLHLTTNFRSVPSIQAAVNTAFSQAMVRSDDGSQAEYVALAEHRAELPSQPGVIALPVPEPYGNWWKPTKAAVSNSYPQAVGGFVEWLLQSSGWQVRDEGGLVPIKPRHVCLLFKRFQSYYGDTTRAYVQSLEARRIPHILVGGRSFHDREEVVALRVALEAIEWPDDELSVYAFLRGPLLAVSDEELLCYRADFSRLMPVRRFDDQQRAKHPAVVDGLELLRDLNLQRNRRPVADTVERLLSQTRAHASLAMWPSGEQALANALAIVDLARNFDGRGGASFRAFVELLEEQAERGQGGEAPIVEEGTEGVRLMTVHKAKGLEFPVVILCDPTAPSKTATAFRFSDATLKLSAHAICGCRPFELVQNEELARRHDDAELVRLSYVAATRARDLLVVPTIGDLTPRSADIGWCDVLAPALYPSDSERQEASPAPGCPPFGNDSVLSRSAQTQATPEDAVVPGLHRSISGSPVVWWDPATLRLRAPPLGGVRQQKLLAESARSTASIVQYGEWLERRRATVEAGSCPSVVARTMTELSRQTFGTPATAVVESTNISRAGRPRGPRFGTLVHALLAHAPFDAGRSTLTALSSSLSRLIGAVEAETAFAVDAVVAALEHPRLRAAARSTDVRREVVVAEQRSDGSIAEGVIDLAYRTENEWVVLDFKTDEIVATDGPYAEQLRLYVEALQRATNEKATGLLLQV